MSEELPKTFNIQKIATAVQNISAELLAKPKPPTREERITRHERAVADWAILDDGIAHLKAITEPTLRAVLDLHWPEDMQRHPSCPGCDIEGYEAEEPDWPCRTVRVIAEAQEIALPDRHLWSRPDPDFDPDAPPPPPVSIEDLLLGWAMSSDSFAFQPLADPPSDT
jgi:hypothetical protein